MLKPAVAVASLLTLLASACGGQTVGASRSPSPSPTPSVVDGCQAPEARDAVATAEEVPLVASDGVRLTSVVYGTGARGVVLGHMGGTTETLCAWAPFAAGLARSGFTVLTLDFRGFGSSDRATGTKQFRQDLDIAAGVAALRARGAKRVVIGGASLGAIASMLAAVSIKPAVDGVINVAGPSIVETMDATSVPPRLTIPILYIVAEADLEVLEDIQRQYARTKTSDKRFVLLPGHEHGTKLFNSASAERFEKEMQTFIERRATA